MGTTLGLVVGTTLDLRHAKAGQQKSGVYKSHVDIVGRVGDSVKVPR